VSTIYTSALVNSEVVIGFWGCPNILFRQGLYAVSPGIFHNEDLVLGKMARLERSQRGRRMNARERAVQGKNQTTAWLE
jgi:hypothetical protein